MTTILFPLVTSRAARGTSTLKVRRRVLGTELTRSAVGPSSVQYRDLATVRSEVQCCWQVVLVSGALVVFRNGISEVLVLPQLGGHV
jgi:hypothetical protein